MLVSPAPATSHSLAGLPVRQFSAVIALAAQGPPAAAVVNDQLSLAAKALPARSLMRGSVAPPRAVTVYTLEFVSALFGTRVATLFEYDTVEGTSVPPDVRNSSVDVLTVAASSGSLK